MANMSYCRFENTANDLRDCYQNLDDCLSGQYEPRARENLLHTCLQILDVVGVQVDKKQAAQAIQDFVAQHNADTAEEEEEV